MHKCNKLICKSCVHINQCRFEIYNLGNNQIETTTVAETEEVGLFN